MINYNLRKYGYKNHPLEYKWGFLLQNNMYANHLCTVVDNHNEIINGKYTHEPVSLLLHMSPDVRKYVSAKLFDEFLYVMIWYDSDVPTYTNWGYKYQEFSEPQVIKNLETVLYDLEPMLQEHTLLGYKGNDLFDDPNHYSGRYVLNDEEEYTISRKIKDISFSKNNKTFYKEKVDEDRFRKAVERYNLKKEICWNTDKLLNEGILKEKVERYLEYH